MDIEIIRSRRSTLSAEIKAGQLIVRAPLQATDADVASFVRKHKVWIEKNFAKSLALQQEIAAVKKLTKEEIQELAAKACTYIPERVHYYAPLVGVCYGRITIRNQRSKWASCSAKGNLNFNCLLILTPAQVIDSVVVHELCHLKEMNHSKRFYAEIMKVFPEYPQWDRWLKDNGSKIMARLI